MSMKMSMLEETASEDHPMQTIGEEGEEEEEVVVPEDTTKEDSPLPLTEVLVAVVGSQRHPRDRG